MKERSASFFMVKENNLGGKVVFPHTSDRERLPFRSKHKTNYEIILKFWYVTKLTACVDGYKSLP